MCACMDEFEYVYKIVVAIALGIFNVKHNIITRLATKKDNKSIIKNCFSDHSVLLQHQ